MADFSTLRNFYWYIRYTRNASMKRKYYRYVLKEKKRLILSGVEWDICGFILAHLVRWTNYAIDL